MIVELCTTVVWPEAEYVACTVTTYVPTYGFVCVDPPPVELLLLLHPVAPTASAAASATASRPFNRRLLGNPTRKRQATATPEPAAYHGWEPGLDLPGAAGKCRSAVIPDKVIVVDCDAEEPDVKVREVGLNVMVGV